MLPIKFILKFQNLVRNCLQVVGSSNYIVL
jgi:hypothetical protein